MTERDVRRIQGRKPTLLMRHKLLKIISRDKLERLLPAGDVQNRTLSRLDLEYYLLARWDAPDVELDRGFHRRRSRARGSRR